MDTSSVSEAKDMLYDLKSNLIYRVYNTSLNKDLRNQLNAYNSKAINKCSDICFYKNKKIIFDNKTCALNCTENNKFNYKNICYQTCPNNTYNISNNECIKHNEFFGYNGYIHSSTNLDSDNFYSSIVLNTNNISSSIITNKNNNYSSIITNKDNNFSSAIINADNIYYSTIENTDNIYSSIPFKLINNSDKYIYDYIEYFNYIY